MEEETLHGRRVDSTRFRVAQKVCKVSLKPREKDALIDAFKKSRGLKSLINQLMTILYSIFCAFHFGHLTISQNCTFYFEIGFNKN